MIKGVSKDQEVLIQDILKPYNQLYDFFYYGSRVKGNYSCVSDLDVLIRGKEEIPMDILFEIKHLFDKSSLPYVVNFTDFYKIEMSFYNLIQKDLIRVF